MRAPSGDVDYLTHQIRELQALRPEDIDWEGLQAELNSLQHASALHEGLGSLQPTHATPRTQVP